jgi:hypothetical protein
VVLVEILGSFLRRAGVICRALAPGACALLLLVFLAGMPTPMAFAADPQAYEKLEKRLKTAGVDAKLSEAIRKAIVRGCTWLSAHQSKSCLWVPDDPDEHAERPYTRRAVSALCALALHHAELPSFLARARRGLDAVVAAPGDLRETYEQGLAALLLLGVRAYQHVAIRISALLASRLDARSGWWGNRVSGREVNLVASHLGALGLWACHREGAGVARATWAAHLVGLLHLQSSSGSWPCSPDGSQEVYPTGTFMGLANLLLAKAVLHDQVEGDPRLRSQVARGVRKGMAALARDAKHVLSKPLAPSGFTDSWQDAEAWSPYQRLFALETVAVFADRDRIGRRPWYVEGARFLLGAQHEDGSWGRRTSGDQDPETEHDLRGEAIAISFAWLFLLRASEVCGPTTPRALSTLSQSRPR